MGCTITIQAPKEWPQPPQQHGATVKIETTYKVVGDNGGGAYIEPKVDVDYADGRKHEIHGLPGSANAMGPTLFALHALGDQCEYKMCNIAEGEQMKDYYVEMNPWHTIPTFKDKNGTALGEGNTIMRYIARKYAPQYYPEEKQHIIDWAMDLRSMKIYNNHKKESWNHLAYPMMGFGFPEPSEPIETLVAGLTENLRLYQEKFLSNSKFIAGEDLTIADFGMAPFVKVLAHPYFQEHRGFKLSERWETWLKDFENAVPCSNMLTNAGGWALQEIFDSQSQKIKE